jgi:RecB family exonuclease
MADDELTLADLAEERGHYSHSSVNTYVRCPYQFLFRYILGKKIPPPSALVVGSTVHETLEYNYKQKIESFTDIPVSKIQEKWASQWELNLKKGIEFEEGETRESLLDEGIKLVAGYQEVVAPTIQPVVVEESFTLIFPNVSKPIIGKIDLIDDKDAIIDHKTAGRTPTQDVVDKDSQLSMYSLAFYEKYRTLPKNLILSYLVKTKKPQYPQLETKRTLDNFVALKHNVAQVVRCIENGIFFPNPHNYFCSKGSCGYYPLCEGGKIKVKY